MILLKAVPYLENEDIARLLILFGAEYTFEQDANIQANRCPFHGNNSPTLGVSTEYPYAVNCFNPDCSARSPDILGAVARHVGCDAVQALEWLYKKLPHISRTNRVSEELFNLEKCGKKEVVRLDKLPISTMAAYALDVAEGIGHRACYYYNKWTPEDCKKIGVGYDRINNRIVFPVYDKQQAIVGIIGRNMEKYTKQRWYNYDSETFKLKNVLLGEHLPTDNGEPIFVCEGASDYFQMLLLGIPNPRSVMGAKYSEYHVDTLVSYDREVLVVFDADEAGYYGAQKIIKQLRNRGVKSRSIKLPKGVKDPRELTAHSVTQFLIDSKKNSIFCLQ